MSRTEHSHHVKSTELDPVLKRSKRYKKRNLLTSPGTLTYIGPEIELKTKIRRIQFNDHLFRNEPVKSLGECRPAENGEPVITWLDVDGIHETGLIEKLGKFGVPRQIVSFVMPTGYSFNLDGSTLYLALATVFVAQATGTEMSIGQQLTMVLLLMLTSKGVAGIPRATLVILLGAIANFGMPEWPVLLIMGIDELMDMARTSVNVTGNCLATAVIARWEGELDDEKMHNSDLVIDEPVATEV